MHYNVILNWYTLFTKCGRWLRLNGTGGFRPCVMWYCAARLTIHLTDCLPLEDKRTTVICNARNHTSDKVSHPKNQNPWQQSSDSWKSCKLPVEPSGWTLRCRLSDMQSHSVRCQLQFLLTWKDIKITVCKISSEFSVVPCILILSEFFVDQPMHKRAALERILKLTLKQLWLVLV
jgi:hypothetical protein